MRVHILSPEMETLKYVRDINKDELLTNSFKITREFFRSDGKKKAVFWISGDGKYKSYIMKALTLVKENGFFNMEWRKDYRLNFSTHFLERSVKCWMDANGQNSSALFVVNSIPEFYKLVKFIKELPRRKKEYNSLHILVYLPLKNGESSTIENMIDTASNTSIEIENLFESFDVAHDNITFYIHKSDKCIMYPIDYEVHFHEGMFGKLVRDGIDAPYVL